MLKHKTMKQLSFTILKANGIRKIVPAKSAVLTSKLDKRQKRENGNEKYTWNLTRDMNF